MAKPIGDLPAASGIGANDKFVLEQSEIAKSLTGQILLNWLTAAADGHGGIQSISKISTSGLVDTYRITLADTTIFDLPVTNGRSINSIAKTSTSGLVDNYTITYNNGTTSKFTVTNGATGQRGPQGPTGPKGDPATLVNSVSEYQIGDSGTTVPTGSWVTTIPAVPQGKYLWTRVTQTFNTGSPVVFYSSARNGVDGSGSVSSVNNVSPDENGNVPLTASNVGALPVTGGDMTGEIRMNGQPISGLNQPTEGTHAANKGYVDTAARKAAPRNLLDNSDFTNLVAQAGIGGNHGTVAYAADRWILTSGTVSYTAGTGMTLNGTITQKLENAPAAVYPYVGMVSGTASISYANGTVTITSSGGVIKWAALYEGSYTAETLPEYQPKGYGAELAECQRYCLVIDYSTNNYISGYVMASTTTRLNAYFPLPVPMRTTPSLSSTDGSVWSVTIDGTAFTPTEAAIWFMSVNAILGMRFFFSSEIGLRKTGIANYNSGTKLILSADL